jgi:HD-GYP domain-containing protein (c-di-GMP phosphodiesterase class II)
VRSLSRLADQLDATAGAGTEHARRVAAYAAATAREFGITGRDLVVLEVGAALHDLGKLCVRKTVLAKPGPLTEQEWDVMRLHPAAGARALATIVGVPEVVAIVRWHHERWDGTGSPDGLRGERIPLGARIVAVADAFQAMTETRPYRGPLTERAARARLREAAGTQFDPACVDAFEASRTSVAA